MKKILILGFITMLNLGFSETIPEIQGISHTSPYVGKEVSNVEGVVTAVYNSKYNKGFFYQSLTPDNDPRTSEGIWVEGDTSVSVGDILNISGTVKEIQFSAKDEKQLTITSIKLSSKRLLAKNKDIKPFEINGKDIPKNVSNFISETLDIKNNAMDYYESLEGMLVKVNNPLITGAKEAHGEISIVPDNGKYVENITNNNGVLYSYDNEQTQRILVGDELISTRNGSEYKDKNFTPNPGDKFSDSIEGVIAYSYGNYKLYNTKELPSIIDGEIKVDTPKYKYNSDMLNVASYNIENFNRLQKGRVNELANQVVTILQTPDILGLVEVEDDDGDKSSSITTAKKNALAIIKAIREKGGPQYDYIDIEPINNNDGGKPGVNIRNIILYRKDRLTLKKSHYGEGSSNKSTYVIDDLLAYNPGKIGVEDKAFVNTRKSLVAHFDFKGKDVIAIVNHLSSKRGDDPIYGVAKAVRNSENNRVEQAKIINKFVKDVLKNNENATFVIMGDMNDFEYSPTIKNMEGSQLINVISELPLNERHTYVHQGNSQVLDNILINRKYKGLVNVDVLNVNSEFSSSQGSFSDHDPIFIQFKVK